MPILNSATLKRDLGGGLWLLPGITGFPVVQNFRLHLLYNLGPDAFCVQPGLVADAIKLLKLKRLQRVRQLQIISTMSVESCKKTSAGPHVFPHNRLIHSLRAAVLHAIVGQSLGFDKKQVEIGILADLLHDAFTCAGGDSWKDLNNQGTFFDEDHKFAEKIWRYFGSRWEELCRIYGFDPTATALAIEEIVHGNGLCGEIHEIADTASYMLGDLAEISRLAVEHRNAEDFVEVQEAVKNPWHIWNYAIEQDGHVVITDPIALNNFLLLRILLWKDLYNNPRRKVLELLMNKIVYPYLADRGLIKIDRLPVKADRWLFGIVERVMGWEAGQSSSLSLFGSFPRLEAFATWDEALTFEQDRVRAGNFTLVFSVRNFQRTNSKADKYRVFGSDGMVGTFQDVFAQHATAINTIAREVIFPSLPVKVVYAENPQWSDNFRRAWKETRAKWLLRE